MIPSNIPPLIREYTKNRPYNPLLFSLIRALRERGYSLTDISRPLNVAPSTIYNWSNDSTRTDPHPLTDDIPHRPPDPPSESDQLSEETVSNLKDLFHTASKKTRWTPSTYPSAIAAQSLRTELQELTEQGVTISSIARQVGVSRRTVYRRIHG